MYKVTKAVTPPDEDAEIVFDIPDGVATSYSRNCRSFKNDYIDGVMISDTKGSYTKQVVVSEDGDIWFSNPITEYLMFSYVRGEFDADGNIVIQGPQFVYSEYDDWDEEVYVYLLPMVMKTDEAGSTFVAADDMKYVLKKTETGYEAADPDMMLGLATYGELADLEGNPTGEEGYAWLGFGDTGITLEARPDNNGVNPPAGIPTEKWCYEDPYEHALINVAVDGDNI